MSEKIYIIKESTLLELARLIKLKSDISDEDKISIESILNNLNTLGSKRDMKVLSSIQSSSAIFDCSTVYPYWFHNLTYVPETIGFKNPVIVESNGFNGLNCNRLSIRLQEVKENGFANSIINDDLYINDVEQIEEVNFGENAFLGSKIGALNLTYIWYVNWQNYNFVNKESNPASATEIIQENDGYAPLDKPVLKPFAFYNFFDAPNSALAFGVQDTVEEICESALEHTKICEIYANRITKIGKRAFANSILGEWGSLGEIYFGDLTETGVKSIASDAFEGAAIPDDTTFYIYYNPNYDPESEDFKDYDYSQYTIEGETFYAPSGYENLWGMGEGAELVTIVFQPLS